MKRHTLLLIVLTAVLVAGPLLWILMDAASPPPPAPPKWPVVPAAPGPRAAPFAPIRPTRTAPPPPASETAVAVVEAKPTTPEPADPLPRAILRITLDGLDPTIPAADAMVVIAREKTDPKSDRRDFDDGLTCAANGGRKPAFDIDVTPLVPEGTRWMGLQLTVDRGGYLPAVARATAWSPPRGEPQPTIVAVRVTLRSAGWASGVVQDERFARVSGAAVGSFINRGRDWTLVDEARTDAQGQYRLRLVPGDANLVVVAADGLEPASIQATGVARAESTLTPFTLRPGLAISGTIRFPDGRPVPDARIVAMPNWGRTEIVLGPHALAYRGGRILVAPGVALADAGMFRVSGLASGDYDAGVGAPGVAPDLLAGLARRVSPPIEGLQFVVDGGRVFVEATCDGRPAPRVFVSVSNVVGSVTAKTDGRGVARVLVLPGSSYVVDVGGRGFDLEKRAITGPPAGAETRVQVALRLRPAALRLALRPEDAEGDDAVTSADVRLYVVEEPPSTLPDAGEIVTFTRGSGVMTGLRAGPYRVVALPRPDGYRFPAAARATLTSGDETRVEIRFAHGGRLHVSVLDAAGKPVAAQFRVLGAEEDETASGEANADVDALLRPGKRHVEVTVAGHEPRKLDAVIRADATTRLEVDLRDGD